MKDLNSREEIERLGWDHVPEVLCDGVTSWKEAVARGVEAGLQPAEGRGDWFCSPVAIKNSNLFKIKNIKFLEALQAMTESRVKEFFRTFKARNTSRMIREMNPPSAIPESKAWNMTMDDVVEYVLPENFTRGHSSAILSLGPWFTEGHVEEGGDDSIAFAPVGKKIFLIANRLKRSEELFKKSTSAEEFVKMLLAGPPPHWRGQVKFYFSDASSFLVQPSLCCHSVLTVSTGPSFVTGWEACDPSDWRRPRRTLRTYATGMQHSLLYSIQTESSSLTEAADRVEQLEETKAKRKAERQQTNQPKKTAPRRESSEASMQMRALADRGFTDSGPLKKRLLYNKRERKLLNLKNSGDRLKKRKPPEL